MDRFKKYSKENLEKIVKESSKLIDVAIKLGLKNHSGSAYRTIRRKIEEFGLDTSHFSKKIDKIQLRSIETTLIYNPNLKYRVSCDYLKKVMLESGIKHECSDTECKITSWKNKPITLEVDHVDGNWQNNRLDNLRFLCPNCHSQTSTFRRTKQIKQKLPRKIRTIFQKRKFEITKEELQRLIEIIPVTDIAKKYQVTDNAIKKKNKVF